MSYSPQLRIISLLPSATGSSSVFYTEILHSEHFPRSYSQQVWQTLS